MHVEGERAHELGVGDATDGQVVGALCGQAPLQLLNALACGR
jgi:hypothetical protein